MLRCNLAPPFKPFNVQQFHPQKLPLFISSAGSASQLALAPPCLQLGAWLRPHVAASRISYASIHPCMLLDRDCQYLKKHLFKEYIYSIIYISVCTNRTVQTSSNICASSYFNHTTLMGTTRKFWRSFHP